MAMVKELMARLHIPIPNNMHDFNLKKVAMTALFAILMAHFGVYVYHNAGFVVILIGLISSLIWFLSLKPANSIIRFLSLMTVAMLTGASVASVFEYFRFADIDLLLRLCTGAFAPVIFLLLMSFLVTINNEWLFLIAVVASGFSLVVWSHLRPGLGFSYLNFRLLLGCQLFFLDASFSVSFCGST